eukprot:TRINITY_DN10225_c0_g2_i1.p1 TRINITY_DN10225_c0_g2~~TRINITY_DN10225_c0_g2_i1.p1  ORF type:complete len:117 (-),score=19.72 TRINITY_DN10225_c0_g2_i1:211-561(-)
MIQSAIDSLFDCLREPFNGFGMIVHLGYAQWSVTMLVSDAEVHFCLGRKELEGFHVIVFSGKVCRCPSIAGPCIYIGASLEQQSNTGVAFGFNRSMQRCTLRHHYVFAVDITSFQG